MFMSRAFVLASVLATALGGCASKKSAADRDPWHTLDAALVPEAIVAAARKAGGAHFHAIAVFHVEASRKSNPSDGKPASPAAVTTMTDVWVDGRGNFRLLESNDQDGGREVVRVGRDLAVALRYGKLVKRPALEAESARFLAEALGAPWSAWEVVRRQVEVKVGGGGRYGLALGKRTTALPTGFPPPLGLKTWRDSIDVKSLAGSVGLDGASKLPLSFECNASFRATRDDLPVEGEVAISAGIDQIGTVPEVMMPDAETLQARQRTILEEKALLGGLRGSALPAPGPAPKKGTP